MVSIILAKHQCVSIVFVNMLASFCSQPHNGEVQSHKTATVAADHKSAVKCREMSFSSLILGKSFALQLRTGQDASIWPTKEPAHRQGINIYDKRGIDSRKLMLFTVKGIVGEKEAAVHARGKSV